MIKAGCWQGEKGPRLMVELGWSDELDPPTFATIARNLQARWGIWRLILRWYMRDAVNVGEFQLDARDVQRDPHGQLVSIAESMARSAIKKGIIPQLPKQFGFHNGTPLLVGRDGAPLPRVTGGE